MLQFRLTRPAHLIILAGLILMFTFNFTLQPAQAQEPEEDYTVFLPLVVRGNSTTTPPPPPQPIQAAFFVQPETKTGSAAIAVDQQGGKHLAYAYYLPEPEPRPAVYLYCPGQAIDCADPANWNGVSMLDAATEVQLVLTPAGQPRLLIRSATTSAGVVGHDIYYAACDQGCTTPDQWTLTYLVTTSGMAPSETEAGTTPQRSFALDPVGRPRFVYLDKNTVEAEPDHLGTFYAYCDDDDCTDPANWFETKISRGDNPFYEHFHYPSLALTSQGQPRVVGDGLYLLQGEPLGIYYLACDAGCDDGSNWERVLLFERGAGPKVSWDLEMDGDRPRLAFYEGGQLNGGGDTLYYAWCNDNCLDSGGWQSLNLGLGSQNGKHPDLELDGQGRPRLAYATQDGGGIGYSWCTGNCESDQGQWQNQVIDTATKLEQEYPVPRPVYCDAGLWDSLTPVLALDAGGNPHVAYDAAYQTRCWYDDNPDDNVPPVLQFSQLWHTVRVNYFSQP